MIVSAKRILELNERYKLIGNLSEREFNPEGVGFDLRVGEVYKISGDGYLGVENRRTPKEEKIAGIDGGSKSVVLAPADYVLVKTMENVNVPSQKIVIEENREPAFLTIHTYPRTTLQRSGVSLIASKTDPGYYGQLTYGMANLGKSNFEFELGSRIANIVFMEVIGDICRAYDGQWKGGRVSVSHLERQT
jgi:deoxycytidine triphosphate deaminase